jgi:HK97 family phage major capsid protein
MKTLEQLRARLAEISARMSELNAVEDFTDVIVSEINELGTEFETVKGQIEAKEKVASIVAATSVSTRKTGPDAPVAARSVEVVPRRKDKMGGFNSFGEFLGSVRKAGNGDVDKRFQNTMFEKVGEDGGFLVPEEMLTDVSKKLESDESLLSRVTSIPVSGNSLSLPTDETSPWNGGVQAYWTAEGAQIQDSKHKFGQANWKLHKLAALVKVTDELLEDSVALEGYIRARAPEAIMHKINSAILTGNGVGKPTGILNSGFRVVVAKESGQLADTVVARNIIKMYSRLIPQARRNAAWYINAAVEEQLRTMKDDEGNFIYLAPGSQMNQTPYGLLMGLPVIAMIGSMPALGDEGDIMLGSLSYYYAIIKRGGMKQAVSQHLYFDRDLQAYKFTMRIDGSCPFKSPVTTEFGNYEMSAFITLADRA